MRKMIKVYNWMNNQQISPQTRRIWTRLKLQTLHLRHYLLIKRLKCSGSIIKKHKYSGKEPQKKTPRAALMNLIKMRRLIWSVMKMETISYLNKERRLSKKMLTRQRMKMSYLKNLWHSNQLSKSRYSLYPLKPRSITHKSRKSKLITWKSSMVNCPKKWTSLSSNYN